jgi:predicted HicB family RNase H-like nuclease
VTPGLESNPFSEFATKISAESLDFWYYIAYNNCMRTGRPRTGRKPNTSIRVDLDILHQARVAAVTQKKTLGQWLEEAIVEKIEREQKSE